jgi:5-methylthioadenosine/S-adenosylhomocysteine deaminase
MMAPDPIRLGLRMYDLLIHNAWVVTVNAQGDVIPDGMIGIHGDGIAHIGPTPPDAALPAARETIDAGQGIVLPGLVNAHTHLPMTVFRGMADDLPLQAWLEDHIFPAEAAHITPHTVHWGTLLGCAEMLLAGITTCCDGYFLEDAVARAVAMTGMRAVLGQGVIDFPAPGVPDPAENIRTAAAFVRQWKHRSPLITPSIFCHSPYTCSDKTLAHAKKTAADEGVLFQIHVAETREEITADGDQTPNGSLTDRLAQLGLLDADTLLVHGVWLSPMDIERIAQNGCGIAHCPESNMKLAAGIAPVPAFLQAGIPVGIGSDGCASNNNQDLLREMDMAAKLHKVAGGGPTTMPAPQVLALATRDGARAIGLGDHIGTIEKGKQADLAILDSTHPAMCPIYNPVSQAVYAGSGDIVRDTVVAGRVRVRNRTLVDSPIDDIMRQVRAIGRAIGKPPIHRPIADTEKGSCS